MHTSRCNFAEEKEMKNKTLVTFGEVMGRIEPEPKDLRLDQCFPGLLRLSFAGAEANVAVSYSLLGGNARFVTALPASPLTTALKRQLAGLGVNVENIIESPGRLGLFFSETGSNFRPSKVFYDRAYSSISMAEPNMYDWERIFKDAGRLHISGITPAIGENAALSAITAVKEADKRGAKVSVDLNFRSKLWNWKPESDPKSLAREIMQQILPYANLVIGNEEDANDMLGIKAGNSDVDRGFLEIDRYSDVAREICSRFPKVEMVACTLRQSISANYNKWGAMLYVKKTDKAFFSPESMDGAYSPYEITDIVDRVGGGDSFAAGLLYALDYRNIQENYKNALDFAVASSALCHTIRGDFNYATENEVEDLLNGNISGRVSR